MDRPDHDHLGILAGLTAMVTGSTSFAIVRFLLGVAEAGFFPGIILYFTYWFPSHHHARIVSGFLVGLPVAVPLARRYRRGFSAWMACSVCGAGKSCTSPKRSQPW